MLAICDLLAAIYNNIIIIGDVGRTLSLTTEISLVINTLNPKISTSQIPTYCHAVVQLSVMLSLASDDCTVMGGVRRCASEGMHGGREWVHTYGRMVCAKMNTRGRTHVHAPTHAHEYAHTHARLSQWRTCCTTQAKPLLSFGSSSLLATASSPRIESVFKGRHSTVKPVWAMDGVWMGHNHFTHRHETYGTHV